MNATPDQPLRCLLINPKFEEESFWDFTQPCQMIGAKAVTPPLGLLTVAALLPQHWEFRLVDTNVETLTAADWEWADLVCAGGMVPQQRDLRRLIDLCLAKNKHIVVGGADPSSQPHLYKKANTLIVGEGEEIIPRWLDSWRAGQPEGTFTEHDKPEVTRSPTPRFDLLDFSAYMTINVQYSRGCPFTCEFCDIIELYGRKPRTKTAEQITRELDALLALGYSGEVFIVADNLVGNKVDLTKRLLPAMIQWNRKQGYPFYYTTEASLNLMDDDGLMAQMREAEFASVFFGIETPDPDVLRITQKRQNSYRPLLQRIEKLYSHGIVAYAGFILGLDGEKGRMDESIIQVVEDTCINCAMVGLLSALPNTQLTRRLMKEGRLLTPDGEIIWTEEQRLASADAPVGDVHALDQTTARLNFRPHRRRSEILEDFMRVLSAIFDPRRYFDRLLRLTQKLKAKSRYRPRWWQLKRDLAGLWGVLKSLNADKETRRLFWRNAAAAALKGPAVFAQVARLMGMFVHFKAHTKKTLEAVEQMRAYYAQADSAFATTTAAKASPALTPGLTPLVIASPSVSMQTGSA